MIYLFLADGFEEIEAVAPLDLLRRAGLFVQTVSIYDSRRSVCGAHKLKLEADLALPEAIGLPDMAILPGGGVGVQNFKQSEDLRKLLLTYHRQGVPFGAICAAPTLLSDLGILEGRRTSCYPDCREQIEDGVYVQEAVCVEEGLITSRGPGTALEFGLALVAYFTSQQEANALRDAICAERGAL